MIKKPQRRRPRPELGCRAIGWMDDVNIIIDVSVYVLPLFCVFNSFTFFLLILCNSTVNIFVLLISYKLLVNCAKSLATYDYYKIQVQKFPCVLNAEKGL
jgi:hypothetical protein